MWYILAAIAVLFYVGLLGGFRRKTPKITQKILIFSLFLSQAGCSGPVTRLRNVSENTVRTEIIQTADRLIYLAEQEAMSGETQIVKRFDFSVDLAALKRELKSRDKRFKIKINDLDFCNELILKWGKHAKSKKRTNSQTG